MHVYTELKDNSSKECNQRVQSITLFTECEELQEVFERKLCALNEDWQKNRMFYIIMVWMR